MSSKRRSRASPSRSSLVVGAVSLRPNVDRVVVVDGGGAVIPPRSCGGFGCASGWFARALFYVVVRLGLHQSLLYLFLYF